MSRNGGKTSYPVLFGSIMGRINEERRLLSLKRRFAIFSVLILVFGTAFIPALKALSAALINTGFLQFFFLMFSDFDITLDYWQNFLMQLAETIPVVSSAVFFGVVFIFLELLRFWARDIKIIFAPKHLRNN